MYNASARIEHESWLEELERIADRLELSSEARSTATDLFLANVPDADRSKQAVLAASVYAGSLVASDGRTQCAVAEAADVSRLSIQQRWKDLLEGAGLEPPSW
ncbi:transcription initiation factor IIB family protein [Natrialbaceae archaeon A-CW3]